MFSTQQYSGFDPRTIPGCALWLDAADTSTITGSPVSTWADKSGNGRNATSPSGPTVSTYNGYRVLSFNGTSQYMISTSTTVQRNAHTLIAVHVPANINGNFQGNTSLFRFQQASGYVVFPFQHGTTPRGYITSADGSGAGSIDATNSTLVENSVTTQFNLIVANIASGNQRVFRNGSQQSSDTEALSSGTTDYLTIGAFGTGSEFYQGSLAEMIIFSGALTTSEQTQVEGYLAWKWGLNTNLPTGHPFRPNPTAMRVFQPIDISACALWYDAADATTITGTTTVSAWNDKSGNARHATATSNHPSFTPGTNYIQFSGSNWMSFPGTFLSNTQYTLFYAVKRDVSQAEMFFMSSGTDTTTNANLHIGYTPNSATMSYRQWANQFNFSVPAFTTQATEPNNVFCFQQTSNQRLAFLNGTQVGSNANTSLVLSNNDALLGVYFRSPTTSWNGRFYEVVMYNRALNTSERQQMEGYLATKWGTSSLLPTTQPYYLSRVLPSTPLFTPTSITGCSLWMDAADISTFTFSSGSNISQWRDKSSNAYTGTAAFVTNPPSLINGVQNNLPGVSLVRSNLQRFTFGNILTLGTNRLYIFTITKLNYPFSGVIVGKGGGGLPGEFLMGRDFDTLNMTVYNSLGGFQAAASDTATTTRLLVGSWDRSTIRLSRNGTTISSSSAVDSSNLSSSADFAVGDNPSIGDSLDGQIMEVVIYTGNLDTSQQQRVEGYLTWKWGLQNSLPTTHPYYKFRP